MTKLDWPTILAAMPTFKPVDGGYTSAQRGLLTLKNNQTVFVKLAVDDKTRLWIDKERHAYHWLGKQRYAYAPELLAESSDGLALPDLSAWDWQDKWTDDKVNAILQAMDGLAALSPHGAGVFGDSTFDSDYWTQVPSTIQAYDVVKLDADDRQATTAILSDVDTRQRYAALSATEPWRGDKLVHYDARADNFAYNLQTKQGMLVDWNWLCFGSSWHDQAALLVSIQLSGFDVLPAYASRLKPNSLAWFVGFWLASALGDQHTENTRRLRTRQVHSAVVADRLLKQL